MAALRHGVERICHSGGLDPERSIQSWQRKTGSSHCPSFTRVALRSVTELPYQGIQRSRQNEDR